MAFFPFQEMFWVPIIKFPFPYAAACPSQNINIWVSLGTKREHTSDLTIHIAIRKGPLHTICRTIVTTKTVSLSHYIITQEGLPWNDLIFAREEISTWDLSCARGTHDDISSASSTCCALITDSHQIVEACYCIIDIARWEGLASRIPAFFEWNFFTRDYLYH